MRVKVIVVGCGGLGGVLSAHLSEAGIDVTTVSRNGKVVQEISRHGFQISGLTRARSVSGRVVSAIPDELFDYCILATQPTDVENAARQIAPKIAEHGAIVVMQNGLCEERVARVIGHRDRVVGAVVAWGASMNSPGHYEQTATGTTTIGALGEARSDTLQEVADLFKTVGPVVVTDNLCGMRWSKLILNSVVSSLGTLNGTTLGAVVKISLARRLAIELIAEGVAVAESQGVALPKVSGTIDLRWMGGQSTESGPLKSLSNVSRHLALLAVGAKYRRLYSSMLRAIESGRAPSVDFLNGEIVAAGTAAGINTPKNRRVCELIWAISRGEKQPGLSLLKDVSRAL